MQAQKRKQITVVEYHIIHVSYSKDSVTTECQHSETTAEVMGWYWRNFFAQNLNQT